jgi:hypothetical protein
VDTLRLLAYTLSDLNCPGNEVNLNSSALVYSILYRAVGVMLLLPLTLLYVIYMVMAPIAQYPLHTILIPLPLSFGFVSLWWIFHHQKHHSGFAWPIWIILGAVLMTVAAVAFIVAHSQDLVFLDGALIGYYFGATPLAFLSFAVFWRIMEPPSLQWHTERTALSRLWVVLGYVWMFAVLVIMITGMAGALAMHGVEAVGLLLAPWNWLSWVVAAFLYLPAAVLFLLAAMCRRPAEVAPGNYRPARSGGQKNRPSTSRRRF